MITESLFAYLATGRVPEGRYSARFQEIGGERWRKHVMGKMWTGTTKFGPPTTTASIEDGMLLYSLVRAVKPNYCIEIGTNQGFSAIMIAAAIAENGVGHLLTIDRNPSNIDMAADNASMFGLDGSIAFVTGGSLEMLPKLFEKMPMKYDFVFEDGDHEKDTLLKEFEILAPRLNPGAYIVLHDSIICDAVDGALESISKLIGPCEGITLGTCRGLTVLRKIAVY